MTVVRAATPGDAAAWLRMRDALWPDEDGSHAGEIAAFFAGSLREPLEVLLAFDADGAAVGYAELSIRNIVDGCLTDRVAFLEGWYVDEPFRQKGVGRALIDAAEQWGRAQGCTEFGSDALIDNEVSRAAHLALGFEETDQIRCFKKMIGPANPGGVDDRSAILQIEQQLAAAWLSGDRAFIETLLAPEWAVTDAAGRVLTRQQVIDETFHSSDRQIATMIVDDVRVKLLGQAAVATGRTRASGRYQGSDVSVELRFTDVFQRRAGRWTCVASHGSAIAP